MSFDQLRYFVAVAEEEHVTRAAERLHVSQPPVSRQLRALEDELGLDLFERRGRRVMLTEFGRHFASRAREILARVDDAVAEASAHKLALGHGDTSGTRPPAPT